MSDGNESPRKMFTRQQYFNLMISSGSALSHDYSDKSKDEDPRMLAFFDSFIQREVDHSFSSDSSDNSALSPDSLYLHFVRDHSDDANSSDRDGFVMPSLLPPELGMISDSDSTHNARPRNGRSNAVKVKPKTNGDERNVSTSSDTAGLSVGGASLQKSDNQEKSRTSTSDAVEKGSTSQASHESSESRRRGRQSRSSSDSSSSSDESEDFLVMRYRSRLLRRIMRQKGKKGKDGSSSGQSMGNSPSQVEKDRLSSLHQRLAFSRVMKERITLVSDSDSSMSDDNEQFLAIVGQLRQRTDSARQRAASLRRHRMRALEEISSLTGGFNRSTASSSLPSSRSPQRDSSTASSTVMNRLAPSNASSPSNSPKRVTKGRATTTGSVASRVSKTNPKPASSSQKTKNKPPKSKLSKNLTNTNLASTSNGSNHSNNVEAAGCSKDNEASSHAKDGSKNGFKKFKVNSSGKKRHYRSTNCYSRQKDSDSD